MTSKCELTESDVRRITEKLRRIRIELSKPVPQKLRIANLCDKVAMVVNNAARRTQRKNNHGKETIG